MILDNKEVVFRKLTNLNRDQLNQVVDNTKKQSDINEIVKGIILDDNQSQSINGTSHLSFDEDKKNEDDDIKKQSTSINKEKSAAIIEKIYK